MESLKRLVAEGRGIDMEVLLFDDYELLDVFGPLELLGAGTTCLPSKPGRSCIRLTYSSTSVSRTATPHGGPTTFTDKCFFDQERRKPPPDVLLVPGGLGTRPLAEDQAFLARLQEVASSATVVLSVCTGSLLLGACGVLDGRSATTNKLAFSSVADACPKVDWKPSARWVSDGSFWTSSGVSAGTDMAYAFLKELLGAREAAHVAKYAEYVPSEDAQADPFAVGSSSPTYAIGEQTRTVKVALVVYDQFEMLDTFGPLEMFGAATRITQAAGGPCAFEITTLAEEKSVQAFGGPRFQTDLLLERDREAIASRQFDMLLIPGGIGCLREVHNDLMKEVLVALISRCELVMTVCSGSTIVASTGALDGKRATSNKLAFHQLAEWGPRVQWVQEARWVVDGKFFTSSGVSAGADLSLHVIRKLFSHELAMAVARRTEYTWSDIPDRDPFAKSIPVMTWSNRIYITVAKVFLKAVFSMGFLLKWRMNITRMLV